MLLLRVRVGPVWTGLSARAGTAPAAASARYGGDRDKAVERPSRADHDARPDRALGAGMTLTDAHGVLRVLPGCSPRRADHRRLLRSIPGLSHRRSWIRSLGCGD